jgi:flagellar hook assembly protein FlgD
LGAAGMLPGKTRLDPNYPNPFNGSTRIGFFLEKAAETELSVLDASGRVVSVLAQGRLSAGRHEVAWDASDRSGRAVSSGVYLVRIRTAGRMEMKKMLLLR